MKNSGSDSISGEVEKLTLTEEQLHVEKRKVATGRVRVQTKVDVTNELVSRELRTEHMAVKRVTVNRYVETPPPIRTEGDVTVIPILEEVLVVEKKLLLKEEIHLERRVGIETVTETVPLRKQRAVVDHLTETDEADPGYDRSHECVANTLATKSSAQIYCISCA
jgi:uncharacterized protein (TIGR02271 family)